MADKNYLTRLGYKRIIDEMMALTTDERPHIVREVATAAAEGDRSENSAYIYGKKRLREIDRRLTFLKKRLRSAEVVDRPAKTPTKIVFGVTVDVEDEEGDTKVYRIVGVDEVDLKRGDISWKSPVGKALLGKKKGDAVTLQTAGGERELVVLKIRWVEPTA